MTLHGIAKMLDAGATEGGLMENEGRGKMAQVPSTLLGKSDSELLAAYPTLRPEDLSNAWVYVDKHREEIDKQIMENEAA